MCVLHRRLNTSMRLCVFTYAGSGLTGRLFIEVMQADGMGYRAATMLVKDVFNLHGVG